MLRRFMGKSSRKKVKHIKHKIFGLQFHPESIETIDGKKMRYLNAPILNRCKERYIDPFSYGWEGRYYETLFESYNSKDYVRDVCLNYMKGLEWVMKYYTTGCADWRWKYNYNYPPLFFLKYIPTFEQFWLLNSGIPET